MGEVRPQRRKKMRLNNGHSNSTNGVNGRRKPFWDNYLRPINSVSSFKAPKYTRKRNEEQKHAQLQQKAKAQPIKAQKQKPMNQIEIEKKIESEPQIQMNTDDNGDDNDRSGFCFVGGDTENDIISNENPIVNAAPVHAIPISNDENKPLKKRRD